MFRLQNAALAVWRSGGREQPPTETEKEAAQGCRRGTRHGTRPRGWDGPGRARPAASACRCGTRLAPVPSRPAPTPLTPSLFLSGNRSRAQPRARIRRNGLSPPAAPLATRARSAPRPLARRRPPSWCRNAPASVAGRRRKDLTHRGCPTHCLMRERADLPPNSGTTSRSS